MNFYQSRVTLTYDAPVTRGIGGVDGKATDGAKASQSSHLVLGNAKLDYRASNKVCVFVY